MSDGGPTLWGGSDAYERYMGRWSRRVAPLFLDWFDSPRSLAWLDVGCGTGILGSWIVERCAPASVLGIDSAEAFLEQARSAVPTATFRTGDAQELALEDGSFDRAVSGLVLNFVADPGRMIAEMARVCRRGGAVGLYVWDYAGHMQIMRYFFDTAREFDPASARFDDGIKAPICRPAPLAAALGAAGLVDVEVEAIDIPTPFDDFDDYWSPFLGGTGSAPKYVAGLDRGLRDRIRDAVRARLPTGPDGEILLACRVWAARGTKTAST